MLLLLPSAPCSYQGPGLLWGFRALLSGVDCIMKPGACLCLPLRVMVLADWTPMRDEKGKNPGKHRGWLTVSVAVSLPGTWQTTCISVFFSPMPLIDWFDSTNFLKYSLTVLYAYITYCICQGV